MSNKKFVEDCLKYHNQRRAQHGVSPLKLNKDIVDKAQKWADHMAKTGAFQHCPDRNFKGQTLGENIAMKWTSGGDDFTGEQCTDQWYSELPKYDFSRHSGANAGHFSQVVWKNSSEFGVGRAKGADGKWLVVANYLPAGNVVGHYKENVFPPTAGVAAATATIKAPSQSSGGVVPSRGSGASGVAQVTRPTSGTSVSTSRRVTQETRGGVTYTKTIITETVTQPDGSKKVTTREEVTTDNQDVTKRMGDMKLGGPSGGASGGGKKPESMDKFINDVVTFHNKYRKIHGKVGDIKHNPELSKMAQHWAEHLAETNILKHSNDTYKGDQLGENVASRWSSAGADYTGEEVVNQWYSEEPKYDYGSNDFKQGTGHFSQVVWKGSKEIGLGKAFGKDGRVFVVANYYPAGNVIGRFTENVHRK